MAAVSDTDLSACLDAGEGAAAPSVTVTGGSVTDGGGNPGQGLAEFDAGKVLVVPGYGGAARTYDNPVVAEIFAGVMAQVVLPDSTLAFPVSFTYTVKLKLEGADADVVVSGVTISKSVFPSGTCDLSQLV
jgi:hypothetical protein